MKIEINGTEVKTAFELMQQLKSDGQGSGTRHGYVTIDDERLWVRKHWSYAGGFPLCSDDSLSDNRGELILEDGAYIEGNGSGSSWIADKMGRKIGDAAIVDWKK